MLQILVTDEKGRTTNVETEGFLLLSIDRENKVKFTGTINPSFLMPLLAKAMVEKFTK